MWKWERTGFAVKKTGLRNGGNNVERRGRRMDSVRKAGKYI